MWYKREARVGSDPVSCTHSNGWILCGVGAVLTKAYDTCQLWVNWHP